MRHSGLIEAHIQHLRMLFYKKNTYLPLNFKTVLRSDIIKNMCRRSKLTTGVTVCAHLTNIAI